MNSYNPEKMVFSVSGNFDEQEVIDLMRREMKLKSFQMWRKRVQGRKTKHRSRAS